MTPEEIRNQCEDDADRAPSDLTVWRDRGVIIAQQQARIAQLEDELAQARDLNRRTRINAAINTHRCGDSCTWSCHWATP